jgi:MFS family permease
MPGTILPVGALLLGAAILLLGNGLQTILLPVRATLEEFSTTSIGLVGAAYPLGFVVSCYYTPHIVKRVGHIRTFAVLAAIAATTVLLLVLLVHPLAWILIRTASGFCLAGVFMVIESWLNEATDNRNRGRIFSTYMVINLLAITGGQLMLPLGDPAGHTLFVVAAIAITLGLVPVGLTTSAGPHPIEHVHLRWGRLYRMSPVGVLGCFFVGLANGAFGSFGAIFATAAGLPIGGVALFMSTALIGGALAQIPFGRLSDRIDRRKVMVLACTLAATFGVVLLLAGEARIDGEPIITLAALPEVSSALLIGFVLLFGGSVYPLYSLCVAHTNDFVGTEDFVEASSGLLLTWGIGATIGPIVASQVIAMVGIAGLFAYTACVHALFALFVVYRMTRRAAPRPAERESFVGGSFGVDRSTPVGIALDPRAPELPAAADEDRPAAA